MKQTRRGGRLLMTALRHLTAGAVVMLLCGTAAMASVDGSAGSSFLKLGGGARAAALGGTYVGIADDVYAARWNPAGLAQLTTLQFGAQHMSEFADVTHNYVALAMPYGKRLTFGADIIATQTDDNYRSELQDLGSFTNHDMALGISAAWAVNAQVALGITGRYLDEQLADVSAHGWSADLGLFYRQSPEWSFGLAMLNVGPEITFEHEGDNLPTVVKAGMAYRWLPELLLAADASFPNDADPYMSAGLEYQMTDYLALRTGYEVGTDFKGFDALSAGLAFNYQALTVDYAFVPRSDLGNIHRVGLRIAFDGFGTRENPLQAVEPVRQPVTPASVGVRTVPAAQPTVVRQERVVVPVPPVRAAETAVVVPAPRPPLPPVEQQPVTTPAPVPVPVIVTQQVVTAPTVPPTAAAEETAAPAMPAPPRNLPATYDALYRLGRERLQAGDYADAVIVLSEANKVKFENFEAHYALACAFYSLGDYASSLQELDLARKYLQ